ncbi:MAG: hypothetical protein LAT57_09035, partial [Balneolales bacterium]|nr:hypothetical protein [Balneolales bacterium]
AVINTYKDVEQQRERAQKILEIAKGHIHAVNSEANPVVETNLNIAEGIRNASTNNAVTDIVIGWNGVISTPTRIFGSILDQVLLTTKQQTYICKLVNPISTYKKIVLLVHPQSYSGRNFLSLLESLFKLAENLKTELEIMYYEQDESKLQRDLYLIKSDIEIKLRSLKTLDEVNEIVTGDLNESDLLIILNNRSGKSDWNQPSNVIPRLISAQRPELSFISAFPSAMDKEEYVLDILYSN